MQFMEVMAFLDEDSVGSRARIAVEGCLSLVASGFPTRYHGSHSSHWTALIKHDPGSDQTAHATFQQTRGEHGPLSTIRMTYDPNPIFVNLWEMSKNGMAIGGDISQGGEGLKGGGIT